MVEPVAECRARRYEVPRNKENDPCELADWLRRKQQPGVNLAQKIFSFRSENPNRKFRARFREERLPTARFAARLRIIRFDGVACAFVYLVLNSSSSPFLRSPSHLYQVVMLYASHQRNCKKKRKHLSPRHLL